MTRETPKFTWFIWITGHEAAVIYLGKNEMEWFRRRLKTGKFDLPQEPERGTNYDLDEWKIILEGMIDRDLATNVNGTVTITPGAAQALLKAKPGDKWVRD